MFDPHCVHYLIKRDRTVHSGFSTRAVVDIDCDVWSDLAGRITCSQVLHLHEITVLQPNIPVTIPKIELDCPWSTDQIHKNVDQFRRLCLASHFLLPGGVSLRPVLADLYSIPRGVTFAITSVPDGGGAMSRGVTLAAAHLPDGGSAFPLYAAAAVY